MKSWRISLVLSFLTFALASSAMAQEEPAEAQRAPDGSSIIHVEGIFIAPIPGVPFSAKVPVEMSHPLQDGTVVSRKFYAIVARDNRGRVHNENRQIIPGQSTAEPAVNFYILSDPETDTRAFRNPAARICRLTTFRPVTSFIQIPAGPSPDGKRTLVREELGKDSMDSLEVIGTRETTTFKPGVLGNDGPLALTKEFWYSPQFHINLSVVRRDPRNGTQTLKVTNLSLTEPDEKLFELPTDYKTVDERKSSE
jgi:hypothetical protein